MQRDDEERVAELEHHPFSGGPGMAGCCSLLVNRVVNDVHDSRQDAPLGFRLYARRLQRLESMMVRLLSLPAETFSMIPALDKTGGAPSSAAT